MKNGTGRRHYVLLIMFLFAVLLAGSGTMLTLYAQGRPHGEPPRAGGGEEVPVTPGEDLMREHGILRRVLLVYEEIDRRARANDPQMQALGEAAGIIKSFIEDYHEKTEEEYVFPRFEKAKQQVELVRTLRAQHDAGRRITARIRQLAAAGATDRKSLAEVSLRIHQFIRMYRPHAAREDTVLFPAFANLVGPTEYKVLGETFEDREHRIFGEHGFENYVNKVAALEKRLGIHDLAKFTPR